MSPTVLQEALATGVPAVLCPELASHEHGALAQILDPKHSFIGTRISP
jgi:hypothetical protein